MVQYVSLSSIACEDSTDRPHPSPSVELCWITTSAALKLDNDTGTVAWKTTSQLYDSAALIMPGLLTRRHTAGACPGTILVTVSSVPFFSFLFAPLCFPSCSRHCVRSSFHFYSCLFYISTFPQRGYRSFPFGTARFVAE